MLTVARPGHSDLDECELRTTLIHHTIFSLIVNVASPAANSQSRLSIGVQIRGLLVLCLDELRHFGRGMWTQLASSSVGLTCDLVISLPQSLHFNALLLPKQRRAKPLYMTTVTR